MRVIRSQFGFTLVELMVVIAVMGVALGLGGGMYVGTYQRMQVEKAARQLVAAARYGRMLALERQGSVHLCLDQEQGRFFLLAPQRTSQGTNQTAGIKDSLCKPVELTDPISLEVVNIKANMMSSTPSSSDGQDQSVTFHPDGSATEAVIQIGDGKRHYSMSICPMTGRVTLVEGTLDKVGSTTMDLDASS